MGEGERGVCVSGFSQMGLTCPHVSGHPSWSGVRLGHLQTHADGCERTLHVAAGGALMGFWGLRHPISIMWS